MDEAEYLHMYEEEERHWWYVGMRGIVHSLLRPVPLTVGSHVLDAGCGTGYNLGWFRRQYGADVTGIDYFRKGLDFCRRRGEHFLVCADAASLPFSNEAFDLVLCFDVLTQLKDKNAPGAALGEFLRVLRPGGHMLIRVAAYEWLRSSHDTVIMTFRRFGRKELRNAVVAAGFRPLRLTSANTILFPAAALWRMLKRAGLAPAGSDVGPTTRGSDWLNRTMTSILDLEAALLCSGNFNFAYGLSIFILASKPCL